MSLMCIIIQLPNFAVMGWTVAEI